MSARGPRVRGHARMLAVAKIVAIHTPDASSSRGIPELRDHGCRPFRPRRDVQPPHDIAKGGVRITASDSSEERKEHVPSYDDVMMRNVSLPLRLVPGLIAIVLVLTGCSSRQLVASYLERGPASPPTVVSALPDEFVVVTVTVSNGQFNAPNVQIPEDTSTVLRVRNRDRTDYQLRFFHDLTEDLLIRARTTTSIEFTTPHSGFFEGRLLSPPGTRRFDALPIAVSPRSGASPEGLAFTSPSPT